MRNATLLPSHVTEHGVHFITATEDYMKFLRANYESDGSDFSKNQPDVWEPDAPGKNFVRIVHDGGPGHRSSYAFIALRDHTTTKGLALKIGDILKPATWKAPTFNRSLDTTVRGNIFDKDSYSHHTWAGTGYKF